MQVDLFRAESADGGTPAFQVGWDGSIPISALRVELIDNSVADKIVTEYHYLHRPRVGQRLSYGVYLGEFLEGVIVYARPFTRFVCGTDAGTFLEFARLYLFHNIPNCASKAIAASLRVVRQDWRKRYGDEVERVVSWSDDVIHRGTIYKAVGFENRGHTKPRKRGMRYARKSDGGWAGGRPMRADHWHIKSIWVKELC